MEFKVEKRSNVLSVEVVHNISNTVLNCDPNILLINPQI